MSAQEQLLAYLRTHADAWHNSAALQRMEWKNRRGTLASPRSVVRRLEELENACLIAVSYSGVNAKYRSIPEDWRKRYLPTNQRAHQYSNTFWKDHAEAERRVEARTLTMAV